MSLFRGHGLAWFAAGLVVVLAAAGVIIFVLENRPTPQVTLDFQEPSQVLVGNPFILTVSYANNSNVVLKNAQLSVSLPDNLAFLNQSPTQRVLEVNVGNVAPGITTSTVFDVVATANPNSVQQVSATMTYGSTGDATAQFQTKAQTNIVLGDYAVKFNFNNTPQNIFSGQNFTITVNYNNQSAQSISDARFALEYPPAFSFVSSSISSAPDTAKSYVRNWDLGPVSAGASSSFTITGNIAGPTNASYPLSGTMNAVFEGQPYPIAQQSVSVAIAQAPLALAIALNNSSSYIAAAGQQLDYTLTYTNNSNVTFQGANITAKLTGAMFDFSKLHSNGSFNSISNTITWNAANVPALAALAPGDSGSVDFSLSTKGVYPIRLVSDKNFVLKALATIYSPTVPPNTAGGTGTQSIVELDSKVGGAVTLAAQGYLSSGPFPPKVNKATKYTIHWLITNYATDMKNVTVSASLQSGSSFTGVVTSNISSSVPSYDPGTGLVTWTVPSIAAATGVLSKPLEATFQISNTPAVNQVGQTPTLVSQTSLTATDNFTGQTVAASDQPITTQLPDDPAVKNISNKAVSQ